MKTLKILATVRISVCLSVLLVFALIPPETIADTSFCLLYNITGNICPSCGSSRALNNVLHLNFLKAMSYNAVLTLFVFPAFLIILINDICVFYLRIVKKQNKYSFAEYLFIGLKEV